MFQSKKTHTALVASRGSGKTVAACQLVIKRLLDGTPSGCAAFFSSTLKQCKKTVGDAMKFLMGDCPSSICEFNASDYVYKFYMGGSDVRTFDLYGYEEPNSKRGSHPHTIILDECGSMPYDMMGIIDPMLVPSMVKGNAKLIAIGTAVGDSKFYEFWLKGLDPADKQWESFTIKASEHPDLFPPDVLEACKNNITDTEYRQEYECDFNAKAHEGSVYGEAFDKFAAKNVSDKHKWNPNIPVWTAWDIGYADYTAIWFFQYQNNYVTFIDYMEDHNKYISYYVDQMFKKPYTYARAILPFDGGHENIRGASIEKQLNDLGIRTDVIKPDRESVGIEAAKTLLKKSYFAKNDDLDKGIKKLRMFKYVIDKGTGRNKNTTVHDDTSHCADAFRYVAMSEDIWNRSLYKPVKIIGYSEYNVLY